MASLAVFIAGVEAGILTQGASGELSFEYKRGYSGAPLSISMPISNKVYKDKIVKPYVCGLLPDDPVTRRNIGRQFGVSGSNPFTLIEAMGLDCPGAVQVCDADQVPLLKKQSSALVPISNSEIARRLKAGRLSVNSRWTSENEHWSLGGQQSKFALRNEQGQWFSCEGSAATTHIFKPGISALEYQAFNEYVCLKLASACGLPAAEAKYELFEDEPAIIVSRFDRARNSSGEVVRFHQEDFCQALGVLPENKYAEYGGPSANDCISLLKKTGSAAKQNIELFVKMLIFNYLIGAPDAHAKNYSLMLMSDKILIAPLYDVASIAPYREDFTKSKIAMSIGGENRVCRVRKSNIEKFVSNNNLQEYGINGDRIINFALNVTAQAPNKLEEVLEGSEKLGIPPTYIDAFKKGISEICKRSAEMIS